MPCNKLQPYTDVTIRYAQDRDNDLQQVADPAGDGKLVLPRLFCAL